jgi:hypothetical protein
MAKFDDFKRERKTFVALVTAICDVEIWGFVLWQLHTWLDMLHDLLLFLETLPFYKRGPKKTLRWCHKILPNCDLQKRHSKVTYHISYTLNESFHRNLYIEIRNNRQIP